VQFVLLRCSLEETVRRGLTRDEPRGVPEPLLRRGHATFERYGDFAGCTIDSEGLTADATADRVMDACGRGDCLVLEPS
jgi:hypothetical protein